MRWAALAAFALFSVVLVASLAVSAAAKPFWHDEIYTILHARLPSLAAMWHAAGDGMDLAPPLNSMVTHGVMRVAGEGRVAVRVPAIAGFWIMTAGLFWLVRARAGVAAAFSAAALPVSTAAFRYAIEARGYGVMLALFTLALVSWSEAARARRRPIHLPLLALWIAAGLWNQYYGVLVLVPIGVGELTRLFRTRKPDLPMWGAIAAGLLLAAPLVPLARIASTYSTTYWRHASPDDFTAVYRFLFEPLSDRRFVFALIALPLLALPALFARMAKTSNTTKDVLPHEAVAAIGCLAAPLVAVALGLFVSGVFVPRYALPGVIGLALVLPVIVRMLPTPLGAGNLLLAAVLLAPVLEFAQSMRTSPPLFRNPIEARPLLIETLKTGPVLVTGGISYLQLWYYAPDAARANLYYLADPAASLELTGADTIDRNYLALRRWAPVGVAGYAPFLSQHREFVVYGAGAGWLLKALEARHADMQQTGRDAGAPVYHVTVR